MASGGKVSKNSRTVAQAKGQGIQILGEVKFITPLNKGQHAYVNDITTGRNVRAATGSETFVEALRNLAGAGYAAKLESELDNLAATFPAHGWDVTAKSLRDQGVFASA